MSKRNPFHPLPNGTVLQRKIAKLEEEKSVLEAQLKERQDYHKSEVETLKKRIEELEQEIKGLKAENEKLKSRMDDMEQRMDKNILPLEEQQETEAYLLLAEMCHQLQNKMYKEVHPSNYRDKFNFTVENIEWDICDTYIYRTEREREKAQGRWERLKDRIGWDGMLTNTIRFLINNRNKKAHPPPPKEEDLRRCMELLKDKLAPGDAPYAKRVRTLMNMYEQV